MSVTGTLKRVVESVLRCRVFSNRYLPWGLDLHLDLERIGIPVRTIFDVGANIGQSATAFAQWWPDATILAFEPVSTTFAQLTRNTRRYRVRCHQLALGSQKGTDRIRLDRQSEFASFLVSRDPQPATEEVSISTVDAFADEQGVGNIDLLKIDTEGFDLHVLRGASRMLQEGRVGAILLEVGFAPENTRHVTLWDTVAFLGQSGYRLAGMYEQFGVFRIRYLERCNALFLRDPTRSAATAGTRGPPASPPEAALGASQ